MDSASLIRGGEGGLEMNGQRQGTSSAQGSGARPHARGAPRGATAARSEGRAAPRPAAAERPRKGDSAGVEGALLQGEWKLWPWPCGEADGDGVGRVGEGRKEGKVGREDPRLTA